MVIRWMPLAPFLLLGCTEKEISKQDDAPHPVYASAQPLTVTDAGPNAPSAKAPAPPPKKRVHRVFAGGTQTRSAWARRLILDERFEKHICQPDGYFLNCITAFRNPDTRVTGPFKQRDCYQAVRDIIGKELGRGQGKWNVAGAFYSNELPATLEPGRDMDLYAARLARRVGDVLLPAIQRHGGTLDQSERCRRLSYDAYYVDGN
ncbi:MAG: hypothetical protein VX589_20560 [Myxococcota bacterium]|nr:hypothetical protein [Myxococcota bacterium]